MTWKAKTCEASGGPVEIAAAVTTALSEITIDVDSSPSITTIGTGQRLYILILYEDSS
jgi:hypothetical protein